MLSMHIKGSRHCAAESRLKERELMRQDEINKRIALSKNSISAANTGVPTKECRLTSKPLIERTRKAVSEILSSNSSQQCSVYETQIVESTRNHVINGPSSNNNEPIVEVRGTCKEVPLQQIDYRGRRDKELKFTAAGWKHDCHGGWYRDENVEFDSDEEDPNASLA